MIENIYRYGSHVYGTNHEQSDEDLIIVSDTFYESGNINEKVYTIEQFTALIEQHDIAALECIFQPTEKLVKYGMHFYFTLNKEKLRTSISLITSNSWVKGKKKLIVVGDYDKYLGIKSIFHSLRILDFGIQIARHGKIIDYSSMNFVFHDLMKMSQNDESVTLWQAIDTKYRKLFKSKSSEFKALCPKNLDDKNKQVQLKNILKNYIIDDPQGLYDELLMLIN